MGAVCNTPWNCCQISHFRSEGFPYENEVSAHLHASVRRATQPPEPVEPDEDEIASEEQERDDAGEEGDEMFEHGYSQVIR